MSKVSDYKQQNRSAMKTLDNREKLYRLFNNKPIPDDQLMVNLGLYIRSGALAKILFANELYKKIVPIPGVVMEFGVWWGQNLVLFENLRAVYEPYNFSRKVIGFDTFKGYEGISEKDIESETIKGGGYTVSENYKEYLNELLQYHEDENVMSHIKKFELVEGNAKTTITDYLNNHPETIVSLAYFDMAVYEPTKACLEAIEPHLIKGSIIAMDEINCPDYPGETIALKEVWGLKKYRIKKSKYLPDRAYIVIE
ncbi:MAG: hypothetical protein K8R07_06515 [Desulfobacterales bacterium]|nr:hypothetical protein [Desulfobacterales bacterium]